MRISLEQLRALPVFSHLATDAERTIVNQSQIIDLNPGKFVYRNHDPLAFAYFMMKGAVQIFRDTTNGAEVTSDILITGDCLNAEDVVSTSDCHTHNAKSLEEVKVLALPIQWVRNSFRTHTLFASHLTQGLSNRLNSAIIEAEHKSTMSAAQITACYLRRLCMLHGYNPRKFKILYSKTLLASRLHMEPETLSRAFKTLNDKGLKVIGNNVCFDDLLKNAQFVCSDCSISEGCSANKLLNKKYS